MTTAPGMVSVGTIRRGWWLVLARTTDHTVTFAVQLLVARLVGPEQFGEFATALLVLTVVEGVTDSGIAAALVHRDEAGRRHLEVAWTLNLVRAVALAGVMVATAPVVAGLVGAPGSAPLIRWLAVVPLIRGLCSPALASLERGLAYRRIAACGLTESIALLCTTLCLIPFVDPTVALVAGVVVGESARLVASYVCAPHVPRFSFDRAITVDLLRYGRWVTGSSVALLLLLYLDDAVVAAMLGASALAVYQLAYRVAGVPASEIALVVNQVAFTSLSRLRSDQRRLVEYFLRSYELVAGLAVPVGVFLAVASGPLVSLLLGDRWAGAVPVIRVLAAWGVLRALGALNTSLFRAVGRPDIAARQHWMMVVGMAALLVPLVEGFGVAGAAVAVLAPNLVIHWLRYRDVAAVLGLREAVVVERLAVPAAAGAAMAAAMGVALVATAGLWPGWVLAVAGVTGSAAYVGAVMGFERGGWCHILRSARLLTRGAA